MWLYQVWCGSYSRVVGSWCNMNMVYSCTCTMMDLPTSVITIAEDKLFSDGGPAMSTSHQTIKWWSGNSFT